LFFLLFIFIEKQNAQSGANPVLKETQVNNFIYGKEAILKN